MKTAPSIAIIGAGLIGRRHAEYVKAGANLCALIDPDEGAKAIAERLGAVWYCDLKQYLAEERPDGAIIATPNQIHVSQGVDLIEAGVPALIEKPIADNSADASRLVRMADEAGVPLLIGHHRRHNPRVAAAKAAIEAGRLGRMVTAQAQFWLYKPDDYFEPAWRRAKGAGPVFINLIHDIDLLRHFCGEAVQVQAMQSSRTRGFDVEDTAAMVIEFESGALCTVTVSDTAVAPWSWEFSANENAAYPHVPTHCYAIGGTEASLSIPDLKLWRHPGKRSWWSPIEAETLPVRDEDPLTRQIAHFCEVIEGSDPLVSGREGLKTLELVEAIKRAAETGAPQKVT